MNAARGTLSRAFLRACVVRALAAVWAWFAYAHCATGPIMREAADPFPRRLLGHQVFKVFREDNMLGYTFRDPANQIFYMKLWTGKESRPAGKGEDRILNFDARQLARLRARIPGLGIEAVGGGDTRYQVVLRGLRVHELLVPVLEAEHRDSPEARKARFIGSILSAREIVIRARSHSTQLVKGSAAAVNASGHKSVKQAGVVGARNVFIGFRLIEPRARDLARRATDPAEVRRVAVMDIKNQTRDSELEFLRFTLGHKLEAALQSLPRFEIMTHRKKDAKYHIKGSYRKIGDSLVYVHLVLVNTYNSRFVGKPLSRGVRVRTADDLYRLQMELVREFIRPLGIVLNQGQLNSLEKKLRQTRKLEQLRSYYRSWTFFGKGKYRRALRRLDQVLEKEPGYLDALLLRAEARKRTGDLQGALNDLMSARSIANQTGDRVREFSALLRMSRIYIQAGRYRRATGYADAGLRIARELYSDSHPEVGRALHAAGWAWWQRGKWTADDKALKKAGALLEQAREILVNKFGPDDPRLVALNGSLAHMKAARGDLRYGLRLFLNNIRILRSLRGEEHPETAAQYLNLGQHYTRLKQFAPAVRNLRRALAIYEKVESPAAKVAFVRSELAVAHAGRGEYDRARELLLLVCSVYEKTYPARHPRLLNSYAWLSHVYGKLGDKVRAREYAGMAGMGAKP